MSLPPLAPIPPTSIRLSIAPEEWSTCLDAWIALAELTVHLPPKELSAGLKTSQTALTSFLRSFYHESSRSEPTDETLRSSKALRLQKICFKLVHRKFVETEHVASLLEWEFLVDFCHTHVRSAALARLMSEIWKKHKTALESIIQPQKMSLTAQLDSTKARDVTSALERLAPVLRASPDIAAQFMTGSDFLDSLFSSYENRKLVRDRKVVVLMLYLGLESLVKVEPAMISLLSDHLYSLKAAADKAGSGESVLAAVVTKTPLVAKLRRSVGGKGGDRLLTLLDTLETYRSPGLTRPRRHTRRKPDKGKARAAQMGGELHMHRMSLVTQVQDLFPDLGSGFVMKLLDEYGDNVETATAHLLDDSLPPHLSSLDRTLQAPIPSSSPDLAPRSTPPPPESFLPERRNVFDNDDLDRLEHDTSRLHIGKKPHQETQPTDSTASKSAILSALAAFDADDDERDDTYDVDDVGGTVDTTSPDGEAAETRKAAEDNDAALFKVYKSSPELFGRTFDIRRGQARQALKAETGMTDEAIEGWAIMLGRDPKRRNHLEDKFGAGAFDGRQTELGRTAYRESPAGTETEDSHAPNAPRGGFRGRAHERGARGGRGRGGGSVAGPSGDAGTVTAQRRKEENKGSRANHNRRDQRARKMGRGGYAG